MRIAPAPSSHFLKLGWLPSPLPPVKTAGLGPQEEMRSNSPGFNPLAEQQPLPA